MECGQSYLWYVTCPDTSTPSHLALAGVKTGSVAAEAEYTKKTKYQELDSM